MKYFHLLQGNHASFVEQVRGKLFPSLQQSPFSMELPGSCAATICDPIGGIDVPMSCDLQGGIQRFGLGVGAQ